MKFCTMACCYVLGLLLTCSCVLFMSVQGKDVHLSVEKGEQATINCTITSLVSSVRWQVLRAGGTYFEVSTCTTRSSSSQFNCINQDPRKYSAFINTPTGTDYFDRYYFATLIIANVTTSETQFRCITDFAYLSDNINLEVYVLPSTPTCRTSVAPNQYVDLICETDNVYPKFTARIYREHRQELAGYDRSASSCYSDKIGTGSKGDRFGRCTFRMPFGSLLDDNTFFVEMRPVVGNNTVVDRPVASAYIYVKISLPDVAISTTNCPDGPGVIGETIKAGTVATCMCELSNTGTTTSMVAGRARWYTQVGVRVGSEDESGQFSVLSFRCTASDHNMIYYCRADNPTASYHSVTYQPKCSASSSSSLISGLTFVMVLSLGLKLTS